METLNFCSVALYIEWIFCMKELFCRSFVIFENFSDAHFLYRKMIINIIVFAIYLLYQDSSISFMGFSITCFTLE